MFRREPSDNFFRIKCPLEKSSTSPFTAPTRLTTRSARAATSAGDSPAGPVPELSPDAIANDTLSGERITAKLTSASGNGAPIGGLKVVTENDWFAARPSGTENIYKIYAESFTDQSHLAAIVQEAQEIVTDALRSPASVLQEQELPW